MLAFRSFLQHFRMGISVAKSSAVAAEGYPCLLPDRPWSMVSPKSMIPSCRCAPEGPLSLSRTTELIVSPKMGQIACDKDIRETDRVRFEPRWRHCRDRLASSGGTKADTPTPSNLLHTCPAAKLRNEVK
jgi:hypothetical protein